MDKRHIKGRDQLLGEKRWGEQWKDKVSFGGWSLGCDRRDEAGLVSRRNGLRTEEGEACIYSVLRAKGGKHFKEDR